jgi:hypothetical protein
MRWAYIDHFYEMMLIHMPYDGLHTTSSLNNICTPNPTDAPSKEYTAQPKKEPDITAR